MTEPFSLVRHAWIPVVLRSGRQVFVRPCDISQPFEGKDILRIATGRPDCDIALTEFMIGILAVAIDGTSKREWHKRYLSPPSGEELEAAFASLEPALMLDGEGPRFFQDREELDGEQNPIASLLIDAPGASTINQNADHFVKRGRTDALSRAGAAIALLTLQTGAPSGGAGHRTSLRGGGPLTTIVLPGAANGAEPTLWQRLWVNVPEGLKADVGAHQRIFPWLVRTRTSDPKNGGQPTMPEEHVDPAQAFFGMPRRIRVVFEPNTDRRPCDLLGIVDDVIVTSYVTRPWGTNYMAWGKGHPLSPYYKSKQANEFLPLHLQSSRVGYRQYLGLVLPEGTDKLPAKIVTEFASRAANLAAKEPDARRFHRLLAAGYAMDNMKPLDFGEALMPLVVTGDAACDAEVATAARRLVTSAEIVASQLVGAVKLGLYGEGRDVKWDSAPLTTTRDRFWADTEQGFYAELRAAADQLVGARDQLDDQKDQIGNESSERWRRALRLAALHIFDQSVPIEDAESKRIGDVIAGRKMLVSAFNGYGATAKKLFAALALPLPESKSKKVKTGSKSV
jgi:CRISPR system Cascade subunit CasA